MDNIFLTAARPLDVTTDVVNLCHACVLHCRAPVDDPFAVEEEEAHCDLRGVKPGEREEHENRYVCVCVCFISRKIGQSIKVKKKKRQLTKGKVSKQMKGGETEEESRN